MPTYQVTAPDGRKLKLTGERPPTEQDLQQIFASMAPAQPEISQLESGLRGTGQGFTLGWGEHLGGLGRQIGRGIAEMTGNAPEDLPERSYGQAVEQERERNLAAQEANPNTYLAGEIIGGFALPAGGARTVAGGGARLLERALRAGGTGAGYGAVAGAGFSDEDRLGGAAEGATMGGAFGAALPLVGGATRRLRNRYSTESRAAREAADLVGDRDTAAQFLRDNPTAVVGDINPRTQQVFAEQAARDPELMKDLLDAADDTRPQVIEALRRRPTKPDSSGYKLVDESNLPYETIARLRSQFPEEGLVANAIDSAESLMVNEIPRNHPSFAARVLHLAESEMKQQMRSAADTQISQQGKRVINNARDQLIDAIDNELPGFKTVTSRYGVESEALRKAKKAASKIETSATGVSRDKYLRDIATTPKYQKQLDEALGPEGANAIKEASAAYNIAMSRIKQAEKINAGDRFDTMRSAADELLAAFGRLTTANFAGAFPGTNPVLARQGAVMDIARATTKLMPFLRATPRGATERQLQQVLRGRNLPEYTPATPEAVTPLEAGAAGLVGVLQGRNYEE